jgi:hypothetical protein
MLYDSQGRVSDKSKARALAARVQGGARRCCSDAAPLLSSSKPCHHPGDQVANAVNFWT